MTGGADAIGAPEHLTAEHDVAAFDFYERHGFVPSPVDPMTLMITIADARKVLGK